MCMSNVFWFFSILYNFRTVSHAFLCIQTNLHFLNTFPLIFSRFSSFCGGLQEVISPFVADATFFSGAFSVRLLYNLYISSAANRVFATKSPAFRGKQ